MDEMEIVVMLKKVEKACVDFADAMEEMPIELKRSACCMIYDMIFGEDSIEIAKDNIAYMEEVNAELGAYKK